MSSSSACMLFEKIAQGLRIVTKIAQPRRYLAVVHFLRYHLNLARSTDFTIPKKSEDGNEAVQARCDHQPRPRSTSSRFAKPMSDKEMTKAKQAAISKKTEKDTKCCMNIWKDWSIHRNSAEVRQEITTLEPAQLQKWLSRFVLEIRKKDGTPYPPRLSQNSDLF